MSLLRAFFKKFASASLKKQLYDHYYSFLHQLPPLRSINSRPVLLPEEANDRISTAILNGEPLFVSRLGTTETSVLYDFLASPSQHIDPTSIHNLATLSGFFPTDNSEHIKRFCESYIQSIPNITHMAARADRNEREFWHKEFSVLELCSQQVQFLNITDLYPFFHSNPWTSSLVHKNVLVIHPFAQTIKHQFSHRSGLHISPLILPEFNLITLQSVQSLGHASKHCGHTSFFHALDYMQQTIDTIEFDVALIGAGAYGLLLGNHCFQKGKQVIHLGGALQLLFGIKGHRWTSNSDYYSRKFTRFITSKWCFPSSCETPSSYNDVEEGCYW